MYNLARLFSQAPVPVSMEGERFAIFESPQPPLHADALGVRPNQGVQLTNTFFDYICGLSADGKPKGCVIASHVFHSFRANRVHGVNQLAKKQAWQRVFE